MANVTLEHVTVVAKVSPITVSRVFSGKGYVAKETKVRVEKAAGSLGYRPNLLARSLAGGKTLNIGLVWSVISK